MNKSITRSILVVVLLISFSFSANAQRKKRIANEDTKEWRYDVECEGVAKQGSKLVKVWSYSKKPKFAIEQAMKNAVHGIIFKGYSGGGSGCTPFEPLVADVETETKHQEFFDTFFQDGGEFRKYVTAAADGNIAPGDRLKVSKREYKIGVVVNVTTGQLRKRLEKEGIIRSLSSGF
jgi:hypothetical protein